MPTLGIWPASGGNAPVTCRSASGHFDGQLIDPVNSHNRPKGDSQALEKRTYI